MGLLRTALFGAVKPLREKLAELAVKGATFGASKTVEEEPDVDVRDEESLGQIDLNARQGYHSDKLGNRTTPIEGFNKEAGMKAPPISFDNPSEFERTMAELPGAMKDTVLAWADKIKNGNRVEYVAQRENNVASIAEAQEKKQEEIRAPRFNSEVFTKGIAHNESRGAADPYRAVGPTKDLGKYQASPDTLKGWSKAWLGREYRSDEFLNDPDAQERFFKEFTRVAERLDLTNEEAAVAWHRGWGELGQGSRETRDERFLKKLRSMMDEDISKKYLESFIQGSASQD